METNINNPKEINTNFFNLDKENGKYELANYGNMYLLVLKGDSDFVRRGVNLFEGFVGCTKIFKQEEGVYYISISKEKLHRAFELYFFGQLYNSESAVKKDLYTYDEETDDNVYSETICTNEKELEDKASALANEFILNHLPIFPLENYKNYDRETSLINGTLSEYKDRNPSDRQIEIKKQLASEDGEDFIKRCGEGRAYVLGSWGAMS